MRTTGLRVGSIAAVGVVVALAGGVPAAAAAPKSAECPGPGAVYDLRQVPWPQISLGFEKIAPVTRGAGVTVAVIDSGVDADHPQLKGAVLPGKDLLARGGDGTADCNGHGTLVAGLIAGRRKDAIPFVGLAPEVKILPVRVLPDMNRLLPGAEEDAARRRIVQAIDFAVARKVQVINLSLTTSSDEGMKAAVQRAVAANIVVVAAVGNEGEKAPGQVYPAAYDGVIGVAGIDRDGAHVASSSVGTYVDIAAPGALIEGPAAGSRQYTGTEGGGTSFAAPFVSATAALIRSYNPALSAAAVTKRILATADPAAEMRSDRVGAGVVNPYRAVTSITVDEAKTPTRRDVVGIPPILPPVDPLATERVIAGAVAGAGAAVSLLIWIAARVIPKGRRRGWRPGRAPLLPAVANQGVRAGVGRRLG